MDLYVKTKLKNGITRMTDCAYSYPYKAAPPFNKRNGIHIMIMAATPGVMSGDNHSIAYDIEGNVKITSQSYTKLHAMEGGSASRSTNIVVHGNSSLNFAQTPVIPYGGSRFKSRTAVRFEKNSRMVYTDILCAGRIAYGERFALDEYFSRTEFFEGERLIFLDSMRFGKNFPNESTGFFEGYTHQGMMAVYGAKVDMIKTDVEYGISRIDGLTVVRAFSDRAQKLTELFDKINPLEAV